MDQQEHAQSPQEALSLGQCEKWKLSIFYIQFLFLSACCCQKQGNKIGKQISSDHFIHIVCATRTNSTRHVAFLLCICYWYLHLLYAKAEPLSANSCGSVGCVVVASAVCGHYSGHAAAGHGSMGPRGLSRCSAGGLELRSSFILNGSNCAMRTMKVTVAGVDTVGSPASLLHE